MHTKHKLSMGIPVGQFLEDYWQQKPLLMRQALTDIDVSVSPEELAGLAMEDFVESRIVCAPNWTVRYGPFSEQDFLNLPKDQWTLLVQGADQLLPNVAELFDHFRFLPSWRLDDIMISYATDGGNVGPHFDQYDVFLLQVQGKRRWRIGDACDEDSELLSDCELSILKNFTSQQEWILESGDILYLPPKIAHWGVALDDCMTFSIGFRAPSNEEILHRYVEERLTRLNPARFKDQEINLSDVNCIPQAAIQQVRDLLLQALDNEDAIAAWFGRYMTQPRYDLLSDNKEVILNGASLIRNPASRLGYSLTPSKVLLFVNGEEWLVSKDFAQLVCQNSILTEAEYRAVASDSDLVVLQQLVNKGVFDLSD